MPTAFWTTVKMTTVQNQWVVMRCKLKHEPVTRIWQIHFRGKYPTENHYCVREYFCFPFTAVMYYPNNCTKSIFHTSPIYKFFDLFVVDNNWANKMLVGKMTIQMHGFNKAWHNCYRSYRNTLFDTTHITSSHIWNHKTK